VALKNSTKWALGGFFNSRNTLDIFIIKIHAEFCIVISWIRVGVYVDAVEALGYYIKD